MAFSSPPPSINSNRNKRKADLFEETVVGLLNEKKTVDEDELFLMSLLPSLKKVNNDAQRSLLRMRLQMVVHEFVYSQPSVSVPYYYSQSPSQ